MNLKTIFSLFVVALPLQIASLHGSAHLSTIKKYGPFMKALAVESTKLAIGPSLEDIHNSWEPLYKKNDLISPEDRAMNFDKTNKQAGSPFEFWGLSSADYQIGGHIGQETSFDRWARHMDKELPGTALDFWNNYKPIIDDAASIGTKMLRISISWERIQPNGPQEWNEQAVARYQEIVRYMNEKGIEPLIVFHHYTIPTWFEDLDGTYLGGFTQEKNNHYFVDFAVRMYQALAPYARYYSTCNMGYEFKAYRENQLAPGDFYYVAKYAQLHAKELDIRVLHNIQLKQSLYTTDSNNPQDRSLLSTLISLYKYMKAGNTCSNCTPTEQAYINMHYEGIKSLIKKTALHTTHLVKANILKAHVDIYKGIHAVYNALSPEEKETIQKPEVGIQVTIHPIYPASRFNPFIAAIGSWQLNHGLYQFFLNDVYQLIMPTVHLSEAKEDAHTALDWIGLNVYDRSIAASTKNIYKEHLAHPERKTSSDKADCPEVIATAVKEISEKLVKPLAQKTGRNIPIIIAENGIAARDDAQRNRYYSRVVTTIEELIKQGYPIKAYTAWSLHDNFEWGKSFGSSRYGMFHVEGFGTNNVTCTLKDPENNFYARFCDAFTTIPFLNIRIDPAGPK